MYKNIHQSSIGLDVTGYLTETCRMCLQLHIPIRDDNILLIVLQTRLDQ